MRPQFVGIIVAAAMGTLIALAAPAFAKTTKECDAEYTANKDAIKAAKEKKADYIAACKALAEGQTTPIGAAPVEMGGTAGSRPPVAASPPPAAPKTGGAPAGKATGASGANEYTTDAQAKAKCPGDTVVWVNLKSNIYHFAGTKDYGTTKEGAYMCEADAKAAGDRAAKNEKHP